MSKLLNSLGGLILYLSLGTILAQCAAVGYLWSHGYLSPAKLAEIDAVLRDFTPAGAKAADETSKAEPSTEQIARARALAQRDIELREQALRQRAEQVKHERLKLAEEIARYNQMKSGFENQLAQLHNTTAEASAEQARQVIENLKPKQAKDQLLRMIDGGEMEPAVQMLAAMSPARRVKVCSEFKTDDEAKKLAEIVRRIREGEPDLKVIDAAKTQIQNGGKPGS